MDASNLCTINAAAVLLERDRGTIRRALRGTPPDDASEKRPKWKLTKIIAALDEHLGERPAPLPADGAAVIREIKKIGEQTTELARKIENGFEILRSEPSIPKRREMARDTVGLKIGEFLELMDRSLEIGPQDYATKYVGRDIMRRTIDEMMQLCDLHLVPDEQNENVTARV